MTPEEEDLYNLYLQNQQINLVTSWISFGLWCVYSIAMITTIVLLVRRCKYLMQLPWFLKLIIVGFILHWMLQGSVLLQLRLNGNEAT